MENCMSIDRKHIGPRLSETAVFNRTVYLAGQIAEHTENKDAKEQTAEILGHIDRLLAEVNSDKTRLLSVQIFLKDMADFPKLNEAWSAWVVEGHTPPRATVEATLADPKCLVEIVVVAAQRD
jgi:enamine deaminase RidA (YjgF/YER057c/UK114 family)